MYVLKKLIPTDGRFSRRAYVLCFVLPGAALLAATYAAFTVAPQILSSPISPAISIGWMAYLTTMDAQNIRRYHDLGNSGALYTLLRPLLVVLPLLAFAIQFLIPAQLATMGDMGALAFLMRQEFAFHLSPIPFLILALWFVGLVSNIAYLACMPGTPGPNSYGPSPGGGGSGIPGAGASAIPGSPTPTTGGDPVERTLAEYRASLAQRAAQAQTARTTAAATPRAAFGKKR
jgi:uncharacterized membrane protein YhaH (DUF805 family)